MFDNQSILITGGTGSFGKKFAEQILSECQPRRLIIFSRDELKQFEMQQWLSPHDHPSLRYFIGDVRDRERLYRAMDGVDIVVHAAAMKQVPAAEYNPIEAVKTNVLGAANIIDAAIDNNVSRVLALSTDKAAAPVNLYGATKLCSDKLFTNASHYVGGRDTKFAVVRYGNVVGSRGSVVPFFEKIRHTGTVPITDPRMTRFWITLPQGVDFVTSSIERMQGGEIFIPKLPSMNIMDLATAIAPECKTKVTGIRPGEKLHEVMITEDDSRLTVEFDDRYVILQNRMSEYIKHNGGTQCVEGFSYSSNTNDCWLTIDSLREMVSPVRTKTLLAA
jgi:UDP-N-acetylglucosamine 4,6-dehydratase/5-epimerase